MHAFTDLFFSSDARFNVSDCSKFLGLWLPTMTEYTLNLYVYIIFSNY